MRRTLLSKSRYTDGLQCKKRLWLGVHGRSLATPPDAAQQAIFDTGNQVGEIARRRWPSGILVEDQFWAHDAAVKTTESLLADNSIDAIFEAGFTELGVRVRADVLAKVEGTDQWDLIEVKSSTSPKPQYDDDISIQSLVIESAGLQLRKKMVLVVNNQYVFDGHAIDPLRFLSLHDRTDEVDEKSKQTRAATEVFHELLEGSEPEVIPSPHCFKPYECPFWNYCGTETPDNSIWEIPRLSEKKFLELQEKGVESIKDVPPDFPLSEKQEIVRNAVTHEDEWVSTGLAGALLEKSPTTYYLDFETINPGVPVFEGTRPFEKVPFQWSCHVQGLDGSIEHFEFLADPTEDPRRPFAESLISQLAGVGPIVVYSGFESGAISRLAEQFQDLRPQLLSISDRLWDLYKVIGANYYHPDFKGSYSIKSVLPVMAPDLAYDDLDIQSGGSASAIFMSLFDQDSTADREDSNTRRMLKEYCARDTLAMVEVLSKLRQIASG